MSEMMSTDKPEVMKLLENAHMAHESGDFLNASRFYERFFDDALLADPLAFYAIRLNNCLLAWGQLAKDFPGAQQGLEQKAESALALYQTSLEPERFHDFVAICRVLNRPAEGVEAFVRLYESGPEQTKKLTKFVWNDLLIAKEWRICSELMQDPAQKLDELFAVFDQAAKMRDVDAQFDTPEFDEHIVSTLLNDLQQVVEVLRRTDREPEVMDLARQFKRGVDQRDHATLAKKVHAQGSYLFVGH